MRVFLEDLVREPHRLGFVIAHLLELRPFCNIIHGRRMRISRIAYGRSTAGQHRASMLKYDTMGMVIDSLRSIELTQSVEPD